MGGGGGGGGGGSSVQDVGVVICVTCLFWLLSCCYNCQGFIQDYRGLGGDTCAHLVIRLLWGYSYPRSQAIPTASI